MSKKVGCWGCGVTTEYWVEGIEGKLWCGDCDGNIANSQLEHGEEAAWDRYAAAALQAKILARLTTGDGNMSGCEDLAAYTADVLIVHRRKRLEMIRSGKLPGVWQKDQVAKWENKP